MFSCRCQTTFHSHFIFPSLSVSEDQGRSSYRSPPDSVDCITSSSEVQVGNDCTSSCSGSCTTSSILRVNPAFAASQLLEVRPPSFKYICEIGMVQKPQEGISPLTSLESTCGLDKQEEPILSPEDSRPIGTLQHHQVGLEEDAAHVTSVTGNNRKRTKGRGDEEEPPAKRTRENQAEDDLSSKRTRNSGAEEELPAKRTRESGDAENDLPSKRTRNSGAEEELPAKRTRESGDGEEEPSAKRTRENPAEDDLPAKRTRDSGDEEELPAKKPRDSIRRRRKSCWKPREVVSWWNRRTGHRIKRHR
uniref:Uncharacterized protein n=1 Tax=Xiphophorus couchianus TaxID=32473 RepID=A0A3B5KV78_9TELE